MSRLKILTNSSGNEKFGGICTRQRELIKYSPNSEFHIIDIENNGISSDDRCSYHYVNQFRLTNGEGAFNVLRNSVGLEAFLHNSNGIIKSYGEIVRSVKPDVVLIPGSSFVSSYLFEAVKREDMLNKCVHVYDGILDKEIGAYPEGLRKTLTEISENFIDASSLEKVSYIFPSNLCKKEIGELYNADFKDNSSVIFNGISNDMNFSIKRNPPSDVSLGYVGRVHYVKNLPFFLI